MLVTPSPQVETVVEAQAPVEQVSYFKSIKDKNVVDYCDFSFKKKDIKPMNQFKEFFDLSKIIKKPVERFPKVAKPSVDMDVTKGLYKGSPEFLDMFLGDAKLKGQGKTFLKAQEKYGINAVFLIAIARLESGTGTSDLARKNNNFGGMRSGKRWLKFSTPEEGIDKLAENLKRKYIDDGLTTVEKIHKRYAEDKNWSKLVLSKMDDIYKMSKCRVLRF